MASVSNLFKSGGLRWNPNADAVGAPEGSLLRADNMVPDLDNMLSLRRGSEIIYSSLGGSSSGVVHSLYTTELSNGTTYRVAGVDDQIYINGTLFDPVVDGSGDLSVADDSYQIFMARGETKRKYDGTNFKDWSIDAPPDAPTLSAVSESTKLLAAFDGEDASGAVTIKLGSGTVGAATDEAGNANEATEVTPDATKFSARIQRLWATDQDYFTINGIAGSETDLFDMLVKFEDPRNVDSIKIAIGVGNDNTNPFLKDRFEFTFKVRDREELELKDKEAEGYAAYIASIENTTSPINPEEITGFKTPLSVKETIKNVGKVPSPKNTPPSDTWGHLTVSRGQFSRVGSTPSRGWNTVRGILVIYNTIKGKTDAATFADAQMVGGGDRTLTGEYKCVLRGIRKVTGPDGNVIYYEKSPPSPASDPINLNHQTLQVTISADTVDQLDDQIDELWVYLFGGWLDAYYRFAVIPALAAQGMTIDELHEPGEGVATDFDTADQRARITSWGHTMQSETGTQDIVFTLRLTELDALTQNVRIEPYQTGAPDNIIDIAGPWNGRLFCLTSDGYVYPSNISDPSAFNSLQVFDLTRYGDPLWIAKTGSGICIGMEKDVVLLQGDGRNSADLTQINLYPQPLNCGNPPIDKCHWREGNSVIFRSNDGLIVMTGTSFQAFESGDTSLIWRGYERHNISLNLTTGRFRATIDNQNFYMLAPEGSSTATNVIWKFSFKRNQWSRMTYPQVTSWRSIFNDPDGSLIAGDEDGRIWLLESGTQDNGNDIPVYLLTPIDDGGNPLVYKDPMDLQFHMNSSGNILSVSVFKDGSTTVTDTFSASTDDENIWRQQLDDIGKFIKLQMSMSGSFQLLHMHGYSIAYRTRPQRMVYLDTGYITSDDPADIVWLQEVEFDANCTEDFTMELYKDDTLYYSVDVSPTTQKRIVNRIPVPRESKGERLRLVFKSDTDSGNGDVGFDPYGVQVRIRNTGNEDFKPYRTIYPAGQAP